MARGCFVTGTGTGVGKTVLAASIVAALRARGSSVAPMKPVITGLDDPAPEAWPHDHELLAAAADCASADVAVLRYGPPVSPHLAQTLERRPIDVAAVREAIAAARARADAVVVEGVGGLLVPLTDNYSVRDLARDIGLPVVIAAQPGLGTINHTLLTLEAARAADLDVRGVALTPWPQAPNRIERSNKETIERQGGVRVSTLSKVERGDPGLLAQAGRALPLDDWIG